MSELPPDLQARRVIEDTAAELATQRREVSDRLTHNTWAIIELLRDPRHSLIPFEQLAGLLGVSRQTLYRWREIGQKIPEGMAVAEAMTMTDEDGSLIYTFG